MDGFVVTTTAEQAFAAYESPYVRHVAALADGFGFIAYDGPAWVGDGATLIADPDAYDRPSLSWWEDKKIRRRGPIVGEVEAFYLLTLYDFESLDMVSESHLVAVTPLTSGNVLVMTDGYRIDGALWGSVAEWWVDKRTPALVSA